MNADVVLELARQGRLATGLTVAELIQLSRHAHSPKDVQRIAGLILRKLPTEHPQDVSRRHAEIEAVCKRPASPVDPCAHVRSEQRP